MSRIEHWRDYRNAICILMVLAGLCTGCTWGQGKVVGPVRYSINPAAPQPIPNGKSLKLTVLKTFFRNATQTTETRDVSSAVVAWSSNNSSVISVSSHGLTIAHQASGTATITAMIRGIGAPGQVSILLTAAPAALQSISLSPFDGNVGTVGGTRTYTATGHYSDATTADLTSSATWAVVNNINGSGGQATNAGATVTTSAAGTVKVTATGTSVTPIITGATYLNIGLTAISVGPTNPSVPKGETQQFTATGTFTAGPTRVITDSVLWVSQTTSVAKITDSFPACGTCPGGGIATTLAEGTSGIYAFSASISSPVPAQTLTVTAPVVTSVVISPSACTPSNVPRGNGCPFTAQAIYSDQTTATVTNSAAWNSDNTNCATIGLTTGLAATLSSVPNPCTANITATFSSVGSNSIALTVTSHALNSISIAPKKPTQPAGNQQQFTLNGHYSDGVFQISSGVSWSSTNTSVSTINSSSGLANAVAAGAATIKAAYNGLNASTAFNVTAAALVSIAVSVDPSSGYLPPSPAQPNTTVPIMGSVQLRAIGTYTDFSTQDLSTSATWNSDNTGVTTVSSSDPTQGLASGVAAGTANITATFGSTSSPQFPLTVKTIVSIAVSPAAPAINAGQQQQFGATINYGSGITQDLTQFDPTWASSANSIATVDQNGNATAVSPGPATISATLGSATCPGGAGGNCGALTVNQPILQSITVSCDPNNSCIGSGEPTLSLGQTEQMIATGHYSDGSNQDLTQNTHLTWASSSTSIATIDTTGFLTTQGLGSTNITATCTSGGGCPGATSTVQGTLSLTVTF